MDTARPLLNLSLGSLAAALAMALAGGLAGLDWGHAHATVALYGFVLPMAAYLQLHMLHRILGRSLSGDRVRLVTLLALAGITVAGLATLMGIPYGYQAGVAVLAAACGMHTGAMLGLLPKRRERTAHAAMPLTKGDDACYAQLRFAHFFFPVALLALAVAGPWWESSGWERAAFLSGVHLYLVGYGLLGFYGISHLAVPRLSGVPAIAAGAIKGELHSTLLGLLGLVAGFVAGIWSKGWSAGLTIGLGFFVFIGAFTFMGVLGANIMKNKSRTQQVTREFTYVPWTFAGVCWILIGVLMGMLLKAIPVTMEDKAPALRSIHAHTVLLGGFAILAMGYLSRLLPEQRHARPPAFQRLPFYGMNAAVLLFIVARLAPSAAWAQPAAALLAGLALAGWFMTLKAHGPGHAVAR